MRKAVSAVGRLAPFLSIAVFGLALWGVHEVLRHYRYREVLRDLGAIPPDRIALAVGLAVAAYAALTGYDTLALRYVRHPLPYRRVGLASFISYALSNTIGFSVLTGASVRYRLYSSWNVSTPDIARVIAFCWATLWVGLLTVGGAALLLEPKALPLPAGFPVAVTRALGVAALGVVAAYLLWAVRARRPIPIAGLAFPVPPPRLALAQFAVACAEWLLASSVLYVLLPSRGGVSFLGFAGLFVLAQTTGLVSHVPGGLGVFEGVILLLTRSQASPAAVAGALLAYRGIYYLLPLIVATTVLGGHELLRRRERVKRAATAFGRWVPRLAPPLFAGGAFVAGAILIFSGVTPAVPARLHWLQRVLPLPLLELSHFIGSLAGIGLLLLAQGLARRLDAAWVLTSALLGVGIGASLLKGIDYEEATVLAVLLAAFLPCRRFFYRHGSLVAERFTAGWAIMIAVVVAGSIWLAHFAFRHVEYSSDLWWHFAFRGDAPRALRAIVGSLGALVAFGIARLLRAAPPEPAPLTATDLERAKAVIATSPTAEANLALLGDKQLLFNPAGTAFIMYGVEGRSWVALRDPVGPEREMGDLAWTFRELVDRHDGWTVFYEVGRAHLPLYVDLGLTLLKLGEEARVPLPSFSLDGSHRASLRRFHRGCVKAGCTFELIPPEGVAPLLPEFRRISDAWLAHKHTREKGFSLGWFHEPYLTQCPIGVVRQGDRLVAFANLWRSGHGEELTVDLMRYLPDAPPNVMTYLLVELMLWGRAEGFHWFNLGMAPLSGLQRRKLAPLWSRLGGFMFHHGEHFYNFRGLRQYKDRFDPVWDPRYLASPGGLALPRVLTNIATLIGGGLKGVVAK